MSEVFQVRYDNALIMMSALSLIRTARGDSFETTMAEKLDIPPREFMQFLFTRDKKGEKLLSPQGSGYFAGALIMQLICAFETIPKDMRPTSPTNMALAVLHSAISSLESQPVEGPKREGNADIN